MDFDIQHLACLIAGLSGDEPDRAINDGTVPDLIEEKYGIDYDVFSQIVTDLLPFTPVVHGGLTDTPYHAFIVTEGGHGRMIVRKEVTK